MIARSLLIVVLALANMHAVLGGTHRAFFARDPLPPQSAASTLALTPCLFVLSGGFTSRFEQFMSFGTRELLATTFRKAKMEKKIAYEGTPLDVRSDGRNLLTFDAAFCSLRIAFVFGDMSASLLTRSSKSPVR